MNLKSFLGRIDIFPSKEEFLYLKKGADEIVELIRKGFEESELKADVFIGGSFAKGTLIKKKDYDIDIFIRFDWKHENISAELEKILKSVLRRKYVIEKVHGSRDYFRATKDKKVFFEIVPVTKISKPKEMRNVTDLSYFHVNYIKKKIKAGKLGKEIALAKAFCKNAGVYGAESYIHGFSGYSLECLIINYKSFEKMLKELIKVKTRLILDPEKKYKNKEDVLFDMNESKLQSPVILVDPTWKERNVLAALGRESFERFQESARMFLKKPSEKFFEERALNLSEMKNSARKKNLEFVQINIQTDKQAGDIAGSKMKKFSDFITGEVLRYFEILNKEFVYSGKKDADFYLTAKSRRETIKTGPPIGMLENAKRFRKMNKNVFIKNGNLHAKIKINFDCKKFVKDFEKKNEKKLREMGITSLKIS